MADITIYHDPAITIEVRDELPPADQAAQIAALTAERDALAAKIAAAMLAAQADKDADDAHASGQGVLDALA